MLEIAVIFFVSLSITVTAFIKPSRLKSVILVVGPIIVFGVSVISIWNAGWRDLSLMWLWGGAWIWGMVIAIVIRLFWMGAAQVTFESNNPWPWIYWLNSALFLVFAAGSIGYAFASNIAVGYAKSYDAAVLLYDRSMTAVAQGFFFLSLAALSALIALARPALTRKGFREGFTTVTEWKNIDSYEWHGDMLIIHRKVQASPRWMHNHPVVINRSSDREIVDRIIAQHLPGSQVQPSRPTQATA